jgi:hypothetical protein
MKRFLAIIFLHKGPRRERYNDLYQPRNRVIRKPAIDFGNIKPGSVGRSDSVLRRATRSPSAWPIT